MQWLREYVSNKEDIMVSSLSISAEGGNAKIVSKGGQLTMMSAVTPGNASLQVVDWSVDDEKVARISSAGILTALSNGKVTVTAIARDGSGVKNTIVVLVTDN